MSSWFTKKIAYLWSYEMLKDLTKEWLICGDVKSFNNRYVINLIKIPSRTCLMLPYIHMITMLTSSKPHEKIRGMPFLNNLGYTKPQFDNGRESGGFSYSSSSSTIKERTSCQILIDISAPHANLPYTDNRSLTC